ncbi:hypothetical protein Caci_1511 [Catenulispora acidiphila DSM 44928]|uniref:Uncharacterized protein n=1 Tax=Catenulispora acidiphila (strain DSM 44928 / JCM 14897 / NBRC 102108 / NRRL B-24433 / ID139908) TaxID=479433 RepID=C7QA34_CATAD|nr:hypothetical protein [Catenulispora acidiphila]ACU70432.1 hypothetical protein Caci_1511 [Catenulispora acidiphila DSM 44928]
MSVRSHTPRAQIECSARRQVCCLAQPSLLALGPALLGLAVGLFPGLLSGSAQVGSIALGPALVGLVVELFPGLLFGQVQASPIALGSISLSPQVKRPLRCSRGSRSVVQPESAHLPRPSSAALRAG